MEQERLLRIRAMELLFDDLLVAVSQGRFFLKVDPVQQEKLSVLLSYYNSSLWLSDYEADERGELPQDLKRGILSQDGFYDFLTRISGDRD